MSLIEKGCLYIVATPIGNLDDITYRAISILDGVDAIAAEDTRNSRKLLNHFGINTPLFALHEHNESQKADTVLRQLGKGETIALISDAGTPLISDPGYILVKKACESGVKVIPVPGASSILAALSCSGLPTDRFLFEGFLPAKKGPRQKRLKRLEVEQRTLILFEAPHRILPCLEDIKAIIGPDRQAVIARELTKSFETFLYGSVESLIEKVVNDSNQSRGEIVLMLEGFNGHTEMDDQARHIFEVLLEELSLKQASALSAKITGVGKNSFYQAGLLKKNPE